ncbi:MAG: DNA-binding transcriptional regulator BasR [Methanobacterium sp. PtaU1.Bin242]|nr:MAG: DNA-binding transcriptional regulator BasR [Methanobacterium sp. PtaU1.Bin242]
MADKPLNVLIIEDNLDDFFLIQAMLEEVETAEFELKHGETLDEGLKLFDDNTFDVMLLDLGLPDSEGFETFAQSYQHSRQIPIIILTGLKDEKLGNRAVKEGAQDYLVKGEISGPLLSRSINYAIERKNAEKKLLKTEESLKKSLQEKEVLLREIHHRVKNNMQIISSLFNLESTYTTNIEEKKIFEDSQNRVKSMAMIHEKLYQSHDLAKIDFADYIKSLASVLFSSYGVSTDIKLTINVEDVLFDIETAVPCGLIVNELLTNSIKHAFPRDRNGEIIIKLHRDDEENFILTVSDNGVGFPEGLDFKNTDTLGLQLVDTLVRQLEGTIELNKKDGTEFIVTFKELFYKKRM